MGNQMINSEKSSVGIQKVNQGCVWSWFHILDYHHWGFKRAFRHKKKKNVKNKRKTTLQDQQNAVTEAEAEAESSLVSQHRETSNAAESSLTRNISIKFKNNDDVLEIVSMEKNLLLKFLKDIDFGGKKSRQASYNKARLTKSGTFPLAAPSKKKNISSSTFRSKQAEIWNFRKGENFLIGTQAPKKFGSNSVNDISYETQKPSASRIIDSAVEKSPSVSSRPSEGLSHKGWNQVVLHQFKVIKQKIKQAVVELKRSGHQTSVHAIHNNEKEISESVDDGAIQENKISRSLNETKASDSDFDFDSNTREVRLMKRTSSLNESMDRYTQLFEKSLSKEIKWKSSKSKSLKLTNDMDSKVHKSRHAPRFMRSNCSMPNLESLEFILQEALLDTTDIGNNAVESDNDAGTDETVEGSSRVLNPSHLSDKIAEKIEGVTYNRSDESFPQENMEISMMNTYLSKEVTTSLETSFQDNTINQSEGKESNTRRDSNASETAEDTNKSLENHFLYLKSYSENNSNFKYVKDILEYSGFIGNEQIQMRYTVDQPIKPSLFIALEESLLHENEYSAEENNNMLDHQLLFNLINETLFQIYEKSPTYFPRPFAFNHWLKPMPKGNYIVKEVWDNVSSYLSLRPELDQTLEDVVGRDLMKRSGGWMNLQQEEECVALDLEEMIIDDLLEEIIFS
ncbi:unnamed protein product [Lathyrus sativus]|nr:unnamed protein product [Lathyrus sativus]